MLEKYIPKRFATAMIKHVIAVTLFFPYYYSHNSNPFCQDFVLANFFAILAIVFICTSWKLDFKRNAVLVSILGTLLVLYNIFATYMNVKYHHWYGEQINTSIAFLLFIILLLVKDKHALIDSSTIKATIHMIVAANVLAVYVRVFVNCIGIRFVNNFVDCTISPYATNTFWLYNHKSEYGFVLVLCVAFLAINRHFFRSTLFYILCQGVLIYALYLSNVYTSMLASMFIFGGQFLDYLFTAKWWKKLLAAFTIPTLLLLVAKELLSRIETERNILTLGYRVPIWKQFWLYIQENPNGFVSNDFGSVLFEVKGVDFLTNNAHNVFLNHLLRFSIPVGSLYILFFTIILIFSLKRKPCFTTFFTWIAVLIPLNMDYSLLSHEFTFFLLVLFSMYFYKDKTTY